MKKLLTLTILALVSLAVKAQSSFEIKYDAAGNRIQRKVIVFNPLRVGEMPTAEKDTQGQFEFSLLPNPTLGNLIIDTEDGFMELENKEVRVYDMQGNEIYKAKVIDQTISIDLNNSPTGAYIVKITANDFIGEWKVVKM